MVVLNFTFPEYSPRVRNIVQQSGGSVQLRRRDCLKVTGEADQANFCYRTLLQDDVVSTRFRRGEVPTTKWRRRSRRRRRGARRWPRGKALYRIVIHASAKIAEPVQVGARRRYKISNEGGRELREPPRKRSDIGGGGVSLDDLCVCVYLYNLSISTRPCRCYTSCRVTPICT